MRYLLPLFFLSFTSVTLLGQYDGGEEAIFQTFRHTRIINSHSVETLQARKLDFRVVHRFGDFLGDNGGWPTFYGLETAADVSIGLEYGITDNVMVGLNRTAGAGPLKQNLNGLVKIRLMNQVRNGNLPLSLTVIGMLSHSTMQKSTNETQLNFFEKGSHRQTSHLGLHLARKFSDRLSTQFNAQWTFRNVVLSGDQNDLVSLGGGLRYQMTKSIGLLLDATFPVLSDLRTSENDFYPALGIGFEFDTSGGHVFQVNFTNATGIAPTDYIPYTQTDWAEGEFRLGFTISRLFNL
ncbi:MAG: DUF5777 family beta-barrel protein [Bacteroidota bacterium]